MCGGLFIRGEGGVRVAGQIASEWFGMIAERMDDVY